MAWKKTNVLEQRREFIKEYLNSCDSFKELGEKYGVSEKAGHKWKNRFLEQGFNGLVDQSRPPRTSPAQLDEDTVIRLIQLRFAHPAWGAKKLAVLYKKAYPSANPPSESSINRVLGKPFIKSGVPPTRTSMNLTLSLRVRQPAASILPSTSL